MKELNQKLATVQTKLKTKKTSYNAFGKYYFRKAEDILEAVKPFLLEQGVSVTINEEIIATEPVPTLQSTATISDGKDAITATAVVGVDLNQKGMQTAQQFGAASSYGKKYALGNLFLIDDTQDSDAINDHGKKASVVAVSLYFDLIASKLPPAFIYSLAFSNCSDVITGFALALILSTTLAFPELESAS